MIDNFGYLVYNNSEVIIVDYPKYQEYNGVKFCRDEKTGYYLNSTLRIRMHRYVWEHEVGEIPEGYEIHHIDKDKSKNKLENLALMKREAHNALHAADEEKKEKLRENASRARKYASEWHGSPEGIEWHKKQAKHIQEVVKPKEFVCQRCGKTFLSKPFGNHKYCSNACKAAARRDSGVDNETRICEICGKEFTVSKYSNSRFCSVACRGINRSKVNDAKRAAGIPVRGKSKRI